MKNTPGKCPVKHLVQTPETSHCPLDRLLNWFKEKVAHITNKIPCHIPNKDRDELVRVSSIYASLLVKHRADVIQKVRKRFRKLGQEFIDIWKPGSERDAILGYIFFDADIINPILLLPLEEVDTDHKKDFKIIAKNKAHFRRAQVFYQVGIENIGKIWTKLLRTYRDKYKRFPDPEELKSFREFVIYFSTKLGESPAFLANAIGSGVNEPDSAHVLQIDASGMVRFRQKAMAITKRKARIHFKFPDDIQGFVENGYCPAVSMIPKITAMCCEAFEAGYTDVYNLRYK